MPNMSRVAALLRKEWLELRGTAAPWLPALLLLPVLALPFVLTLIVPALANEPLEQGDTGRQVAKIAHLWPALRALSPAAQVQAFMFQQFLLLALLVPVSGAMSLAAHSMISEKQARTLEPLLATPLTSIELLLAKVLAALAPSLVLEVIALTLYCGAIALLAEPGVVGVLVSVRSLVLVAVIGPLASLVALQLVVLASTRAKDPRSAQQIGVVVVLPLVSITIGQGTGALWLSAPALVAVATLVALLWLALLGLSVALFSPERMLTSWK